MTYQRLNRRLLAAPLALAVAACAGSDNPTALADLETAVEFEVSAAEIQTLEEVEFHIHVEERGMHLDLLQAELAIRHAGGEAIRTVALEQEGDEYRARVTFFEPGEHHVHVMGMPRGHGVMGEMGEFEVDVARRHEDIGPYWVEIATSPAGPLLEGQEAHIHIFVFDLLADGARGAPVTGLEFVAEMHHPHGTEMMLEVVEEGRTKVCGLRGVVLERREILVLRGAKELDSQRPRIWRAFARTFSASTAVISPRLYAARRSRTS